MKRLIVIALVAIALPLAAAEQLAPPAKDSPLVAAAKQSNRKGKAPADVITNATLQQIGGRRPAHFTTTAKQRPLPRSAKPASQASAGSERVAAPEAAKTKTREKLAEAPREDAASSIEGPEDESDPCNGCLIILDPVPPGSPMSRGILTRNPPHVVTPSKAPVVAPRQP